MKKLVKEFGPKLTWKFAVKFALTLSLGFSFGWTSNKTYETHKYEPTLIYRDTVEVVDTLVVSAVDSVHHFFEPSPFLDTVHVYIPHLDTLTIFDHFTVIETLRVPPWEPPEGPPWPWGQDGRRPGRGF